jgi:hypothetical protein
LLAFVGDSTMTSGRPPDAADRRRAGTFVPPSVAGGVSLSVFVVFVGTVLLSVVRGVAGAARLGSEVHRLPVVGPGRPGAGGRRHGTPLGAPR